MAAAGHDKIVKLVFIKVVGAESRKTVVPLVEGCDFSQFQARVRRRLGLPDDARVALSDTDSGPVDTIDRLLEVDESATLIVDAPSMCSPVPMTSPAGCSSAGRGPAHRTPRTEGMGGGSCGTALSAEGNSGSHGNAECRLDVPISEWTRGSDREGEESGALKYRKRRRDLMSLARSQRGVLAVLILIVLSLAAMYALS
eukprot:CAMPEP_0115848110 /NCGR_PEP_ID=MMETSP0287-20121206/10742_1 /TAXON_ID=412157 /ORGANISM="Chrysochromulina rotalis, Strain UIO044" /LENGTH=198 /DNA_ID=CAMNT_0003301991 /DNA_START=36 /DNA_END=632 /DNA_ORIENTATION=-